MGRDQRWAVELHLVGGTGRGAEPVIAPDLHQQKHARAGMTLVEMLVSLSLMAVLVTVSVSWMTNILERQGQDQEQSRWTRAAYSVLDQIGRDLNQIELIDDDLRRGEPRIWINEE